METSSILLIAIAVMVLIIIISVLLLLAYVGAFAGVDVRKGEPSLGAMTIAYKYCRDYPVNVDEAFRGLTELCPKRTLVTLYYDNPSDFATQIDAKIRFCIACVLRDNEQNDDDELLRKLIEKGFVEIRLPKVKNALHSQYPFTCSASVGYAEQRVLPAISQIVSNQSLKATPIMEIVDCTAATIQFVAPLELHQEFSVPELENDPIPPPVKLAAYGSDSQEKKNE